MIRSLYVKSPFLASTSSTSFWLTLHTQTEWVIFEQARTNYLVVKAQNFEYPIFTFGFFSFLSSIKFLQVTKTFASCSFCLCTLLLTLIKSFFSSTYLLKFSSSKTFATRCSVSLMIAFLFSGAGFANISPKFFYFMWSSNKVFKYIKIFMNSTFDTIYQAPR